MLLRRGGAILVVYLYTWERRCSWTQFVKDAGWARVLVIVFMGRIFGVWWVGLAFSSCQPSLTAGVLSP